jgi:hypothetical protein
MKHWCNVTGQPVNIYFFKTKLSPATFESTINLYPDEGIKASCKPVLLPGENGIKLALKYLTTFSFLCY